MTAAQLGSMQVVSQIQIQVTTGQASTITTTTSPGCQTKAPGTNDNENVVGAGRPCQFPFHFNNQTYNKCVNDDATGAWCRVAVANKPAAWGNCNSACQVTMGSSRPLCLTAGKEGVGPNQPCNFPFIWKGAEYNKCIIDGWVKPWCQVAKVTNHAQWGICNTTICPVEPFKISPPKALCFPGDAKVISRSGPRDMAEIRIGDELLGFNSATGKPEFTRVHVWLHREPYEAASFIKLHTSTGGIVMSAGHNIAVGRPDNYVFARDAHVGSFLLTPNGTSSITSRSQVRGKGIYAPWTTTSNLYVGAGEGFFLAHSLANVPSRFEKLLNPLFSILSFVFPFVHGLDPDFDLDYMHPVVRLFWSIVGVKYSDSFAIKDGKLAQSSEKDRVHPMGSLVALLASAAEGSFV
eukprot:gnl/TRDRNA2_/TRDRNA2_177285_c7_seq12.p1 gnl/TRDRNA2_/TRDRNA2_177285_c7~~gnl/TRDRNA2_/TRDRNA2_177285_c7_seq12.p1  ORF type:complete len:468 (-),score=57.26 gnl/TRDRNA2_/TRDRNA2_177285_c7_seq12:101-1321(-)